MEANENELLTNRSENENENSNDIQNENGSEADVPEPAPAKTKFKPIRIKQELQIAKVQSRYEESPEEEQSDQFDYSSADRGTALQV